MKNRPPFDSIEMKILEIILNEIIGPYNSAVEFFYFYVVLFPMQQYFHLIERIHMNLQK